jgi:hypothetical protein
VYLGAPYAFLIKPFLLIKKKLSSLSNGDWTLRVILSIKCLSLCFLYS